jgi:uncharacterized protein HemY
MSGGMGADRRRGRKASVPARYPIDARSELRTIVADARQRGDVQGQVMSLLNLADFLFQLGRLAEAEAAAREAARGARLNWKSELHVCLATLAEALASLDAPDAQEVIAEAQQWIESHDHATSRPQLLRAIGLMLMRRNDFDGAFANLTEGAPIARGQKSLIQLGRTLEVLSRARRSSAAWTPRSTSD